MLRKSLLFAISALCFMPLEHFAQVEITYGGINPPEMPALAGSEYLAKVDDNTLFTGSSTQNSITLLTFDENNPSNPFTLVQNWIGNVDGFNLGEVKDLHFDNASNLLYVVQQNPSKLVVLNFNSVTNALTFHSSSDLTGLSTPERFAMTDELLIVLDVEGHKAADLTFDGVNSPTMIQVHDLASCGVQGDYKDLEIAPNGEFAYVTCFSPASLIKLALSPNGMTCNGVIDLNVLVGSGLAGDLTFLSEDRALVTSCIGTSGVVRMTETGDFSDSVPGSLSLFDPMKALYLPSDSTLVVQSMGTNGGTYKLNSDYSITQIGVSSFLSDFNNEFISMSGDAIVRSENHDGFLGVAVRNNGVFDEVSRSYAGGTALTPGTISANTVELSDNENKLYLCTDDGIQTLHVGVGGTVSADAFFNDEPWVDHVKTTYIDDTHLLVFNSWNQSIRSVSLDFGTGEVTTISEQTHPGLYYSADWQLLNDRIGMTMLIVPEQGNTVYSISFDENYALSPIGSIALPPEVSSSANLRAALAPSSNTVVIVSDDQCVERLIRLDRSGQSWSTVQNDIMNSIGSDQCPVVDLCFTGSDHELIMLTNNGFVALDTEAFGITQDFRYFSPDFTFIETQNVLYNEEHDLLIMATSEISGTGQEVRVFEIDANPATTLMEEQVFEISNSSSVHGFNSINNLIQLSDGSAFYATDEGSGLVHTFGIQDMLVSSGNVNQENINLFPNPTNSTVSVQFSEPFNGTVNLIDNLGRTVSNSNVNGTSLVNLDLSDLPTGLYHVTCTANNGERTSQRLVKKD